MSVLFQCSLTKIRRQRIGLYDEVVCFKKEHNPLEKKCSRVLSRSCLRGELLSPSVVSTPVVAGPSRPLTKAVPGRPEQEPVASLARDLWGFAHDGRELCLLAGQT